MARQKEACIRISIRVREDKDRMLFDLLRYLRRSTGRTYTELLRGMMEKAARTRIVQSKELRQFQTLVSARDQTLARLTSLDRAIDVTKETLRAYEEKQDKNI